MPELGRIPNEAAAALIGVAPYDDDSGERRGQRHIKGGRRKLRALLYMPIMGAATQHKLIVILNTMLARDETWSPPDGAAA